MNYGTATTVRKYNKQNKELKSCLGVLPFLVLIYLNKAIYVELKKLQVGAVAIF
jgi:hypothetical protein